MKTFNATLKKASMLRLRNKTINRFKTTKKSSSSTSSAQASPASSGTATPVRQASSPKQGMLHRQLVRSLSVLALRHGHYKKAPCLAAPVALAC